MATPIPLCQPTQYPSTLALVAIPQVGTPHTIPSTIVDFCGHAHTQFQQSPIFHLIVINFAPAHHILGPSLPNSTLLSNFLLSNSTPLLIFAHTHIHLLLIVINSASAQCLCATTIHPPPVFPPLHHQSVVAHTTHVICLLHCGLGCPPHCGWVGVLVVLGDGLGESWLCGRSCSWRYSLLCAKIFFLFYLRLTCIMFCQLLSESFD